VTELRVDWLPKIAIKQGRLGITLLPGRRDAGREIQKDIRRIKEEHVHGVVCLVTHDEFARYGVDGLLRQYHQAGLEVLHVPIVDGGIPSKTEMHNIIEWIDSQLSTQKNVIVHCVGGLGRAGTVAACWLKRHGVEGAAAIQTVRDARSPRAIETTPQEEFVMGFGV
jgi:protein-tyrosine phosphatase